MRKSGKNLMAIIDDVLTFSNIDTNRIVLESAPVDLRQVIDEVKIMVESRLAQKPDLQFRTLWGEAVPKIISGDYIRLRQILYGLVSNAIKFTETGNITVHCSALSHTEHVKHTEDSASSESTHASIPTLHPKIAQTKGLRGVIHPIEYAGLHTVISQPTIQESMWKLSPNPSVVRIDVSDTGIGIAKEQLDDLFKPFLQVDNSPTRQFGGTGLGLSIVKGLVQLMGGNVLVKSELGYGSTFSVLIPFDESVDSISLSKPRALSSLQQETEAKSSHKPLLDYNILIVDDVAVNRLVLEAKLLEMGASVKSAANGLAAVELLQQYKTT
jgi:signal transduction histidine kinase